LSGHFTCILVKNPAPLAKGGVKWVTSISLAETRGISD